MKSYSEDQVKGKDMIMIWRAIFVTAIALAVCALAYVIYRPNAEKDMKITRDLGDIVFVTNANGEIYKIR